MLIRADQTFRDAKGFTGRVFPVGSVPEVFRSSLPTTELYTALATDGRSVRNVLRTWSETSGAFQLDQISTIMRLQVADQISAARQRIYGQAVKFGLVEPADIGALPLLFNIASQIYTVAQQDLLAEQLALDVSLTILGQLAPFILEQISFGGWAGFAVNFGVQFAAVLSESLSGDYSRAQRRMPLVTPSRDADEFLVEQVHSYTVSARDWTNLFLPAHVGRWTIFEAGTKAKPSDPGRWGFTFGQSVEGQILEDGLTPAGGIGALPGTNRVWSSIQLDCTRLRNERDRDAWWPMLFCNYRDDPCYRNEEDFIGDKDCRQCVSANGIRGTTRGDWQTNIFAPMLSHAINVGDGYPTASQSLAALFAELCNPKNPASWSVHVPSVANAWDDATDRFFGEDAARLWRAHNGLGWRYVCSCFFSWFLVNHEGLIAGPGTTLDWRQAWGENLTSIGGQLSGAPLQTLNVSILSDHAGPKTDFTIENSWYRRLVRPALEHQAKVQLWGYRTLMVACLPRDAGAHFNAATGKIRDDAYGRAYLKGLQDLYTSPRRFSVDLRNVVELSVREALIASGVPSNQIGLGVQAPTAAAPTKPKRAPPKPTIVELVPTLGSLPLVVGELGPIQPLDPNLPPGATLPPPSLPSGGFPGLQLADESTVEPVTGWQSIPKTTRRAVGITAAVGAAAIGVGLATWATRTKTP